MGKPGFPIPLRGGGVGKPGFPTPLFESSPQGRMPYAQLASLSREEQFE